MADKIRAYIDSYEIISLLLDKSIDPVNKEFYLLDGRKKTKLEVINTYEEYDFYKYIIKYDDSICLNMDYLIIDELGNEGKLLLGSIIRTPKFDEIYAYDGPLGFEYHKAYTVFRVWSPVAKEMFVELYHGEYKTKIPFIYKEKGLWEAKALGDMEGFGYLIGVRVFDEIKYVNDPYAISSAANHRMNYVIDNKKLYKLKNKKPYFSGNYTDAIIYEASIRDFTYELENDKKGTFLGLLENNKTKKGLPTGIDYIQSLGITHLQLLPIFDFGGVDDIKKDKLYNWGYNPEQYFVPSGWYSMNPDNPYSRINELLELIDNIHSKGIRVNMDVVFNHVYKYELFPFDTLVPGYYFRVEANGRMSNASGCGNDLATEKYMCSRFVCDVLEYFARMFNISGFRFDLMGLLDVNTLNKAYKRLMAIDDTIMVYGEGWNMMNPLPNEYRAHMYNHTKIPNYGFFNDRYRDTFRGSQWQHTAGFIFYAEKSFYDLSNLLIGSCVDYFKFNEPSQSINYVECHDNYTVYDFAKTYIGSLDERNIIDSCKLALQIILVSQGVPFIHAGQEFFRTKRGIENSYATRDSINKIDFKRRDKYSRYVDSIKDLIALRREYDVLRMPNRLEIQKNAHPLDGLVDANTVAGILQGDNYNIIVIIKNNYSEKTIELENTTMIFDSMQKCNNKNNRFVISNPGVYLLKKEKKHGVDW